MYWSIITFLENTKLGIKENAEDYFNKDEKKVILNWFEEYVSQTCQVNKFEMAINLMYDLYIRENFDVYDVNEFNNVVAFLSEEYGLSKDNFLILLTSFRELIYE